MAAAHLGGGVVGGGQFAAGDDEVAAAEVVFALPAGQVFEDAEELLAGIAVALEGLGRPFAREGGAAIEVGGDKTVLPYWTKRVPRAGYVTGTTLAVDGGGSFH